MAGSWVCEPCPTSSFIRENSILHTPAQFQVWRRQPLARDPGPSRIPRWRGYLVLLRGSPTEPGVLIHEAGILVLGFSQLQFLRDQRSSGEGAWHPQRGPCPPSQGLPSPRGACISQERSPATAQGKCAPQGNKDEIGAERDGGQESWPLEGPPELTSSSHRLCFFRASCSRLWHFFRFLLSSDSCGVRTQGSSCGKAELPTAGFLQPLSWDLPAAAPSALSLAPLGPRVGFPHPPGE